MKYYLLLICCILFIQSSHCDQHPILSKLWETDLGSDIRFIKTISNFGYSKNYVYTESDSLFLIDSDTGNPLDSWYLPSTQNKSIYEEGVEWEFFFVGDESVVYPYEDSVFLYDLSQRTIIESFYRSKQFPDIDRYFNFSQGMGITSSTLDSVINGYRYITYNTYSPQGDTNVIAPGIILDSRSMYPANYQLLYREVDKRLSNTVSTDRYLVFSLNIEADNYYNSDSITLSQPLSDSSYSYVFSYSGIDLLVDKTLYNYSWGKLSKTNYSNYDWLIPIGSKDVLVGWAGNEDLYAISKETSSPINITLPKGAINPYIISRDTRDQLLTGDSTLRSYKYERVDYQPFPEIDTVQLVGEPLTFRTANVYKSEYEWDFGDGSGSSEQTPIKTYDKIGKYTIAHTVKTKDTVITTYHPIEVISPFYADIETEESIYKINENFIFKTDSHPFATIDWYKDDEYIDSNSIVNISFDSTGVYNIILDKYYRDYHHYDTLLIYVVENKGFFIDSITSWKMENGYENVNGDIIQYNTESFDIRSENGTLYGLKKDHRSKCSIINGKQICIYKKDFMSVYAINENFNGNISGIDTLNLTIAEIEYYNNLKVRSLRKRNNDYMYRLYADSDSIPTSYPLKFLHTVGTTYTEPYLMPDNLSLMFFPDYTSKIYVADLESYHIDIYRLTLPNSYSKLNTLHLDDKRVIQDYIYTKDGILLIVYDINSNILLCNYDNNMNFLSSNIIYTDVSPPDYKANISIDANEESITIKYNERNPYIFTYNYKYEDGVLSYAKSHEGYTDSRYFNFLFPGYRLEVEHINKNGLYYSMLHAIDNNGISQATAIYKRPSYMAREASISSAGYPMIICDGSLILLENIVELFKNYSVVPKDLDFKTSINTIEISESFQIIYSNGSIYTYDSEPLGEYSIYDMRGFRVTFGISMESRLNLDLPYGVYLLVNKKGSSKFIID